MKKISKENLIFEKIPFWIICIFLTLLPFQAFLLTWIRFKFNLSPDQAFFISFWKEYLIVILFVIAIFKILFQKKFPFKILTLDKYIIAFFILSLAYFLFFPGAFNQKIAGLRYDLEFFLVYFLARCFTFSRKEIKTFLILFLGSSIFIIIFGLLQISYLEPSFLVNLGYSKNLEVYSNTGIIPTYASIHPLLPNLYRIQSTFPGALQFSSYLILVISIVISPILFFRRQKKSYLMFFIFLLLISVIALFATYSRSAWIGLFFAVFVMLLLKTKKKKYVIFPAITFALIGIIAIISFFKIPTFQMLVLHGEMRDGGIFGSTQAHQSAFFNSLSLIVKNPLGIGIGAVGPASKLGSNVIIPESWYFQIALEIGLPGLIIFISIIFLFFKKLLIIFKKTIDDFYKLLSLGLIGALIGISVSSLLLHTWADTATTYPFWLFTGLLVAAFENSFKKEKA